MRQVYKMLFNAAADGSVAIDVRNDGVIDAVMLDVDIIDGGGAGDGVCAQLSFKAAADFTTSDSTAIIAETQISTNNATSAPSSKNVSLPNVQIPVNAGERLYLHADVLGTCTPRVVALLYVDERGSSSRPAVRRRA